jgi:hypothetical protein
MQKDHKNGPKGVHWKAGQSHSELDYSRPPIVISSSSFKRYDLEEREIPSNTISLAAIAGRFIPAGLKLAHRKRSV